MKRLTISLLLFLLPLVAVAQRTFTVSGTVTDVKSGETLIGATVVDTRSGKGVVTNLYGHYSLTLKSDSVDLKVSFVGYETQIIPIKGTTYKITLHDKQMKEAVRLLQNPEEYKKILAPRKDNEILSLVP